MTKLPLLKGPELVAILEKHGFKPARQRGSHVRMRHPDGRVTTVPVHKGENIGRGLLRKILRDTELDVDDLVR